MTRRRAVGLAGVALVVFLAAAGNAQYLFCSTYRVKNDSGPGTIRVSLSLDQTRSTRRVTVVDVPVDASRTGWLRFAGEASLRADVESAGGRRTSCSTYIESGRYHVDINVDAGGNADCRARLVSPLELGLLNVIP